LKRQRAKDAGEVDNPSRFALPQQEQKFVERIFPFTLIVYSLRAAKHDQIVPPAYSENLVTGAKTIELKSGSFWRSQSSWLPHTLILPIAKHGLVL
jgi:hypothetical protein